MASGDTLNLFYARNALPAASGTRATFRRRNTHPVLHFASATATTVTLFAGLLARIYSGGGITVRIQWIAESAVAGDVVWEVAFERMSTTHDIDADSFASAKTVTQTCAGTSGILVTASIAFTNGEIDGLLVGEPFRLQLSRLGADAADTMTGGAQVLSVELRET
jgi:hypothetical protein